MVVGQSLIMWRVVPYLHALRMTRTNTKSSEFGLVDFMNCASCNGLTATAHSGLLRTFNVPRVNSKTMLKTGGFRLWGTHSSTTLSVVIAMFCRV